MSSPARETPPGTISSPGRWGLAITRRTSGRSLCSVRLTATRTMSVGRRLKTVRVLETFARELEHLEQRHQEGHRALGAFVLIRLRAAEPIATARGDEVVEGEPKPIGPQEPGERFPHPLQIVMIAGRQVGTTEGQHERCRVDGLFIRVRLRSPAAVPSSVADQNELPLVKAHLLQELERLASDAQAGPLARHRVRLEEREGNQGVVVRERWLEPAPTLRGLLLVTFDELLSLGTERGPDGAGAWLRRQEIHQTENGRGRAAWAEVGCSLQGTLEHLSRQEPVPIVVCQLHGGAQGPDRSSQAVVRFGAWCEGPVVAHQVVEIAVVGLGEVEV